jgi:hypothetical protein
MRAFILCGSREWTDVDAVFDVLRPLRFVGTVGIFGGARGADTIGAHYWAGEEETAIVMPAQWSRDGKAAGPIRNEAMLRVLLALQLCGYEVSVEAFSLPSSVGTAHMKRIAEAAGVVVNEHGTVRE